MSTPGGGGRFCDGMRAAQAAASSGVAMGFTGGTGFATGAANFVDASEAFVTAVAGSAAGVAGLIGAWRSASSASFIRLRL